MAFQVGTGARSWVFGGNSVRESKLMIWGVALEIFKLNIDICILVG